MLKSSNKLKRQKSGAISWEREKKNIFWGIWYCVGNNR
jgi:hypothetical protein